ncbi:IS30 family transposase [Xanthomonas oryzae]|uniref:IS30 family transposase n=1 Tax=Xanthomonas oryzae TaxID=347 RepID=UPI0000678E00|nr:IS30 family transposase [Xanthomonas oryzae]BAE68218.1 IS1112 transposase [Xanthomonas oryzae pv. oryzae MAFF 311018]
MSSSRLDLSERYCLHALHETGMSMRAIADALERAPSTISRELRRNQHAARYRPDHAQRISEHRRTQASRRPRIDAERIGQIEDLLREDFSPEQIAGRTGLASHEWIYRHIYADQKRGGQLFMHLRKRRRKRRRRGMRDGRGQLTHRRSWTQRPSVVEQRSRIGDWELDTIRASHGKGVVVSMTERRSRLHLLAYSPDGTAENVRNAIVQRLGGLRHTVHTLTADNGKEFADHRAHCRLLAERFLYSQIPYCAWQRGSNAECQRVDTPILATHRPHFSTITNAHLRWIEQRLYNRPRKILGFKTPLEVFSEEVLNSVANQS